MKILIAEDDRTSALLLEKTLRAAGYAFESVINGKHAVEALKKQSFDAVITDWMMPEMDGIALVQHIRSEVASSPVVLMITAIDVPGARDHALSSGADGFLNKPARPKEVRELLRRCLDLRSQPVPQRQTATVTPSGTKPPFVGVGIAASTGGPNALRVLASQLKTGLGASYMLVQHGPDWMFDSLSERLDEICPLKVCKAQGDETLEADTLYIAPGGFHLGVGSSLRLRKDLSPERHGVKPAADVLFEDIARVFGRNAVAVVLTGLGRDGAHGAQLMHNSGAAVLAQDPEEAVAPYMPKAVLQLGLTRSGFRLQTLGDHLNSAIRDHRP